MRRRNKIILWFAFGTLLVPAAFWFFFIGFTNPPLKSMSMVHDALKQARSADAPVYARDRFHQAESLLQLGENEMARQNRKLPPFRSYSLADSLLLLAYNEAVAATGESKKVFVNLKSEAQQAINKLRHEIQSRREKMNDLLVNWDGEKLIASAKLHADIGSGLLEKKEYKHALIEADSGRQFLTRLDNLMDKYLSEQTDKRAIWNQWVNETISGSKKTGGTALIVDKQAHKLFLFSKGNKIFTYDCELGYNSSRQKLSAGDGATPEGKYLITSVRPKGSKFYKALMLNYPNERDKKRFAENKAKGIIRSDAHIGGLIEIHGHGGQKKDWTDGCVALTNADMDHLMKYVRTSTPVTIVRHSELKP